MNRVDQLVHGHIVGRLLHDVAEGEAATGTKLLCLPWREVAGRGRLAACAGPGLQSKQKRVAVRKREREKKEERVNMCCPDSFSFVLSSARHRNLRVVIRSLLFCPASSTDFD